MLQLHKATLRDFTEGELSGFSSEFRLGKMQGPHSSGRCSNEVVAANLTRILRSKQRRQCALLVLLLPSPPAALTRNIVEAQAAAVSKACVSDLLRREVLCSRRYQIMEYPARVGTCIYRPATLSVGRSRAPDSFRSWTKLGHYRTHQDTPVIFDLGHAIWSARGVKYAW